MQIDEYIKQLSDRFAAAELEYGHGTDNSLDEAVYLVFSTLRISYGGNDKDLQRMLRESELDLLESRAKKRIEDRVPVAYLVGEAWFAGHRFLADQRALVPRSPVAELIAQQFEPLLVNPPRRILDLCTGGGCIGIACALEFENAQVVLADISEDALQLAQQNINLHNLQARVSTRQSDLFNGIDEKFDLIVCNPPYVSAEEVADLPREFHHEPVLGLLSADQGLAMPLAVLAAADLYLEPDGVLIMEVGCSHYALSQRLPDLPFLWLEFEFGGEGVFMLTRDQLRKYRESVY